MAEKLKLSEPERMVWKFSDKDQVPMGTENEIANLSDMFGMDEKNILAHIRGPKLTVKQTAKMLNVQPRCVYDMISEGELDRLPVEKRFASF